MKKILMFLLLGMFLISLVSASAVTRSLSSTSLNPGDSLSVTLSVLIDGGETF